MSKFKVVYANEPELIIRKSHQENSKKVNHVLLGTWLRVMSEHEDWLQVETAGRGVGGWVRKRNVREKPCLKIFFVDVGQGDGAIIESPNGNLLIDGGLSKKFHSFMKHRYKPMIDRGEDVHFDALVMSHPDRDHFEGLKWVLKDENFTFGTIYHNGIIRYDKKKKQGFDLGRLNGNDPKILTETFSTLNEANKLAEDQLMITFREFWEAAKDAQSQGRLKQARRITSRNNMLPGFASTDSSKLRINILGPVPTTTRGPVHYVTFPDPGKHPSAKPSSSHTCNGHSIVLKLTFGNHSFLFGGDLNIPAQKHLLKAHVGNPFRVDVAKACHHGSSDFSVEYLKKVKPHVNIFSSGDNKSYDHPMADALGATGRHTQGDYPLLFSTEIARANTSSGIHYGLVNARSNGKTLVMAQMKEVRKNKADIWDSYTVPWKGRFPEAEQREA